MFQFMERPRDGRAILEHKSGVIRLREASRASTYAVLHMTSSPPATTVKLINWFANVNINTTLLKYHVANDAVVLPTKQMVSANGITNSTLPDRPHHMEMRSH
ncbi:hypothetical protein HYFRA_00013252 [Hymenoscyphus fraxineus]|uniref:Uncharacterized protein n=1 Tax=Hymenoscyphus fraxineus TaxID=746836 RepID=A0A9N9L6R2_9HELO|nr:hypothetical protein HYFRA_00013252 [Hymenoscyphus fraxineus]